MSIESEARDKLIEAARDHLMHDTDGRPEGLSERNARLDRAYPLGAPHRVEQRTVSTGPWKEGQP